MIAAPTPIGLVVNVTQKAPGAKPEKVARMVFPNGASVATISRILARFYPEGKGFRCDFRQQGPQGYSLPLDVASPL